MNTNNVQTKNIFTNSGIRDKAGCGYLALPSVTLLGKAIGALLAQEFDDACNIVIAMDTRTTSPEIKQALLTGLCQFDHNVYDAGICPTPLVAKALKDYQEDENDDDDGQPFDDDQEDDDRDGFFALGIVITASHNPAEYNGIKILTEFGYLTEEIEIEISNMYHEFLQQPEAQHHYPIAAIDIDLVSFYQSAIMQQLDHVPFKGISVLLDCAHGATALIAPRIFQACGITTKAINNDLNGALINKDSSINNPEQLLQAMKDHHMPWGCAFDGDGDRVIMAHRSGVILDGDDIVTILSQHPAYQEYAVLVGTIMTNQSIIDYLAQQHKKLIRVSVGERNVITELMRQQTMLGSETCGHITMMDHAFCSDGIFAALMVFDTFISNPNIIQLPYQKRYQSATTIDLAGKKLEKTFINSVVSQYANSETRIVVRPSNTEPVLRIMVEHLDQDKAQQIAQIIKQTLQERLK